MAAQHARRIRRRGGTARSAAPSPASFTVVSEYSFAGISQTNRQPAVQPGLHYRTPSISEDINLWAYVAAWGSNVDFPGTGPGIEVDLLSGIKFLAFERRMTVDMGYVRYLYPGVPGSFAYDYGDFVVSVGYDFDLFQLNGRVRYSLNSFGASSNASEQARAAHGAAAVPAGEREHLVQGLCARSATSMSICPRTTVFPTMTIGTGRQDS